MATIRRSKISGRVGGGSTPLAPLRGGQYAKRSRVLSAHRDADDILGNGRRVLGREGVWWPGPVNCLLSAPRGQARRFDPPLVGTLFSDGEVEIAEGVPWTEGGEPAFRPLRAGGWSPFAAFLTILFSRATPASRAANSRNRCITRRG